MNDDITRMRRAIELALLAEREGNLPIGAIIVFEGETVAEGRNAIWAPRFDATRHAEMEALRAVPQDLWASSERMSLYTTLEPCLMCFSSILLHGIGRVLYGASDPYGGASPAFGHLPTYFREHLAKVELLGPTLPGECDPLFDRSMALIRARKS